VRGRGARALAGVVLAAFAVAVPAAGGQGEPFSLTEFPAGQLPSAVAAGNLNRDSKLDLAGPRRRQARRSTQGQTPTWLAAGDLNGDGNEDLVTTNWDPCLVSVFLGHGDGTFTSAPGSPYQGPMGDASVVLADFNGDGNLDAATGDLEHDSAAVMLGNGTGALQLLATYPTGQYTVQIVSADFNGDGNLDLATANRGTFPADQNGPPFTSSVSVLLCDGTGHFPTAISVPMGSGQAAKAPTGIAVGDFDRDGLPDLATSDLFTNSAGVLLNREG
jgi:hypothetical protein